MILPQTLHFDRHGFIFCFYGECKYNIAIIDK